MSIPNDNTTPGLSPSTDQPTRTGIVLNRMYTGSYLSSNLGHEVINMFQADNGKHYLYLNARGNFDKKTGEKISDMLLVRYVGENRLEILAWASELTPAPGADKSYKKFEPQSEIRKSQGYIISSKEREALKIEDFPEGTFKAWNDEILRDSDISYGGANLIKIFEGSEQQNIYITYRAGKFRTPTKGKRLFLEFVNDTDFYDPEKKETEDASVFYFSGYLLGKTTLHQFILDDDPYKIDKKAWDSLTKFIDDYEIKTVKDLDKIIAKTKGRYLKLKTLINVLQSKRGMSYNDLKQIIEGKIFERRHMSCASLYNWLDQQDWLEKPEEESEGVAKKVSEKNLEDHKPREKSLFDIVPKLQRDENCFSDALKFFIDKDKDEWHQVLAELCSGAKIGSICSIKREQDATITPKAGNTDTDKTKGGRIDLLIRTENAYIVIENKIKSDINSNKQGEKQLNRYRSYVNYRIIGDYIDALEGKDEINEIKNNYDKSTAKDWEKWLDANWLSDTWEKPLKKIYEQLSKKWIDIKAYLFILAPDYNMPNKDEREGYLPLYYSTLVGKDKTEMVEDKTDDKTNVGKEFQYLHDVAKRMRLYHKKHGEEGKENLWTAFYDAMRRHRYNYEHDS